MSFDDEAVASRLVATRLRAIVAGHLDVAPDRLTPEVLLAEELGIDSLAAIELGMTLEDEFGISLTDEVLAGVHTYGDVEAVVAARAGEPGARR